MSCKAKRLGPATNRRISMSFRECEMEQLFEMSLNLTKVYAENLDKLRHHNSSATMEFSQTQQLLETSLQI